MSTHEHDPELEALLKELAPDEEARALLLEEHRQLEKDLLRIADPLPPADFVNGVMARVAAQPVRPVSRAEVVSAVMVVLVTATAGFIALAASGAIGSEVGTGIANLFIDLRQGFTAAVSALTVMWRTAALPMVVGLGLMFLACVAALRRFTAQPPLKVIS